MTIAFGIMIVVLVIIILKQRQQVQDTIQYNLKTAEENNILLNINKDLKQQNQEEELRLANVKDSIAIQNNILKSLIESAENMREGAEQQAKSIYEARIAALNVEYDEKLAQKSEELEKQTAQLLETMKKESAKLEQKVSEERNKLADLESKQLAYIQAQQRAEEIEAQKDYYRPAIDELDLEDVKLLRDMQTRLRKKESIDKVIWENYYKTPYDLLMSHIFEGTSKTCGIYKITNLQNGQAYIGQSVDIRERFRQHIKSALTSGPTTNKLYQQMKKFGPENFTFEVLEIVERSKLNERETYWIDFYKTKDYGMNSTKGNA